MKEFLLGKKARALNIIEISPTFYFPRDKIERFHFSKNESSMLFFI
jgi:hypothetical protein